MFIYHGFRDAWKMFIGKSQNKILGALSFLFGIFLVFMRHPFLGAVFQFGGGGVLFRQHIPKAIVFITSKIPGGRFLLTIPWISRVCFHLIPISYNLFSNLTSWLKPVENGRFCNFVIALIFVSIYPFNSSSTSNPLDASLFSTNYLFLHFAPTLIFHFLIFLLMFIFFGIFKLRLRIRTLK